MPDKRKSSFIGRMIHRLSSSSKASDEENNRASVEQYNKAQEEQPGSSNNAGDKRIKQEENFEQFSHAEERSESNPPPSYSEIADSQPYTIPSATDLSIGTPSSIQNISKETPEPQPEQQQKSNTQTRPNILRGRKLPFCEPCQQARKASNFQARFTALFDPLHCAACGYKHSAILFSEEQRKVPDSCRICIAHQGYCSVCPHLRFTLADVRRWIENPPQEGGKDGLIKMRCQDKACPFSAEVSISFPGVKSAIEIQWNVSKMGKEGSFWSRCTAKLQDLHQVYPGAFCPHLQTTSYRVARWELLNSTLYSHTFPCAACYTIVTCDPEAEHSSAWCRSPIRSRCRFNITWAEPAKKEWIQRLNPDSYKHFSDQDTKNITWCDDRTCATTFELLRHSSLQDIAVTRDGREKKMSGLDSCVNLELWDRRVDGEIRRLLGLE